MQRLSLTNSLLLQPPFSKPPPVARFKVDFSGAEGEAEWHNACAAFRPDVVVHVAALASPAVCEKEPALAAAANAPPFLFDVLGATAGPDCLFLYTSTDLVLASRPAAAVAAGTTTSDACGDGGAGSDGAGAGVATGALLDESAATGASSVYAGSKLALERLARERWPARHVVLRGDEERLQDHRHVQQPRDQGAAGA